LLNQIKAAAYERAVTGKKAHNFPAVLPDYLAEQAEYFIDLLFYHRFLKQPERQIAIGERAFRGCP